MNSGVVLPAGAVPMGPRNPYRKFKKKDGTSDRAQFYNVEGEASMRVHTQETLDISRDLNLSAYSDRINRETLAYESWKFSFANLCQEPELTRKIRTRTLRADGRWLINSKTINKVLICSLLEERWVNGSLVPKDEWGSHTATAREYRSRMQRSEMERKGNTRHDGTVNQSDANPPQFTHEMSTQRAAQGMEQHVRPSTTVQLTMRYFLDNMDQSKKTKVEVSKPPQVALPWNTQVVSVDDLIVYGTPANDPVDLVRERRSARRLDLEIRKLEAELREVPKVESMAFSEFGEFTESTFVSPEEETARYLSWMRCPDVMREALYTDSTNREVLPRTVLQEFSLQHPSDFRNWRERYYENEDTMYHTWLAKRDVHNNRLRKLKRLHLPKTLTNLERLIRITGYRIKAGRLDVVDGKRALDAYFKLQKIKRWHRQAPALVAGAAVELLSREDKFQILRERNKAECRPFTIVAFRIGLDHQIPMTDMEYDNITRTEGNTVDSHVKWQIPLKIDEFNFSLAADVIAEESYQRVMKQMRKPIIGRIELGTAYELCDESGFILPNFESPDLARVLDQVSK